MAYTVQFIRAIYVGSLTFHWYLFDGWSGRDECFVSTARDIELIEVAPKKSHNVS